MPSQNPASSGPSVPALYLSAILGTLGHAMFVYGLVVVLGDRADGPLEASLAYATAFGAMAIMTPVRGFLGDILPIAPLIRNCILGMALAVFAFACAVFLVPDPFALFLASLLIGGFYGYASGGVAGNRVAMVPLITSEHAKPTIILSMMSVFGFTFGPLLYGLSRLNLGDGPTLFLVAVLLLGSAATLPQVAHRPLPHSAERPKMWTGIWEGVTNIFSHRSLWAAMLLGVVPTAFVLGPVQAMLPEFISVEHPGAELFRGTVFVALGIGTLCGGIVSTLIAKSPLRQLLTMLSGLLACTMLALLLAFPGKTPMIVLAFCCGAALGVPHAMVPVLLQDHVADSMRARTMAALTLKLTGLPALGAALCGMLASVIGLWEALLAFSMLGLATGLALIPLRRQS